MYQELSASRTTLQQNFYVLTHSLLNTVSYVSLGCRIVQVEAFLLLDLCTETLASCVAASPGNRLPEAAALAAFTAVAEAVAALHAQQPPIAHR